VTTQPSGKRSTKLEEITAHSPIFCTVASPMRRP
jgi:hypothetical protein